MSVTSGVAVQIPPHVRRQFLNEKLVDSEPAHQSALDAILLELEATVGRNVSLATSLAICQAGAKHAELSLRGYVSKLQELPTENQCVPMPWFSVVNGGVCASNRLFAQEVLLIPTSAVTFADALQIAVEFNSALQAQLEARGVGFTNRGALGGFAPQLQTLDEVFQVLRAALDDVRGRLEDPNGRVISTASASPLRVDFGVDFAASEFVVPTASEQKEGETPRACTYNTDKWVSGSTGAFKTSDELLEMVRSSIKELELTTVVDPFDTGDLRSFSALHGTENDLGTSDSAETQVTEGLGGDPNCRVQVVGCSALHLESIICYVRVSVVGLVR